MIVARKVGLFGAALELFRVDVETSNIAGPVLTFMPVANAPASNEVAWRLDTASVMELRSVLEAWLDRRQLLAARTPGCQVGGCIAVASTTVKMQFRMADKEADGEMVATSTLVCDAHHAKLTSGFRSEDL